MKFVKPDLTFIALFRTAVAIWPDVVDVGQLVVADSNHPDLYAVAKLGSLADSIAESANDRPDRILIQNMHDAIASVVRSAALYSQEVRPCQLRPKAVQQKFENRLNRAISDPDLKWSDDDIALVNKYFYINADWDACPTIGDTQT